KIIWISITILLVGSAVIIWQIMNKPKKSADISDAMDLERIDGFDELEEQVVVKKDITYNKNMVIVKWMCTCLKRIMERQNQLFFGHMAVHLLLAIKKVWLITVQCLQVKDM